MEIGLVQGIAQDEMIVKVVENGKEISIRFRQPPPRSMHPNWTPWHVAEFEVASPDLKTETIDLEFFKD